MIDSLKWYMWSFESMLNYFAGYFTGKRHLPKISLGYIAYWSYLIMIYILLYCMINTVTQCIKNKKVRILDVIFIVFCRYAQNVLFHTSHDILEILIGCSFFIVLMIMYKTKIVPKTKKEEKVQKSEIENTDK